MGISRFARNDGAKGKHGKRNFDQFSLWNIHSSIIFLLNRIYENLHILRAAHIVRLHDVGTDNRIHHAQ
jgi:hypothetical protein